MSEYPNRYDLGPTLKFQGHRASVCWKATNVFIVIMSMTVLAWADSLTAFEPALDMTLETLEGRPLTVSEMRNSVILLNFWGTWCRPCLKEIPDLIKLSHRFRAQGFKVIGVALASGSSDDIRAFAKTHGMDYSVLIGDLDEAKRQFQVRGFPTSVLIDGQGMIRKRYFGPQTEAELTKDVMLLLSSSLPNN